MKESIEITEIEEPSYGWVYFAIAAISGLIIFAPLQFASVALFVFALALFIPSVKKVFGGRFFSLIAKMFSGPLPLWLLGLFVCILSIIVGLLWFY